MAATCILWQDLSGSVILLDIPRSIAAAQGDASVPCRDVLLSTPPQTTVFGSNEPRTEAAKTKLAGNSVGPEMHTRYRQSIQHALDEIRRNHVGTWCLPRSVTVEDEQSRPPKKRKIDICGTSASSQQCNKFSEFDQLADLLANPHQYHLNLRMPNEEFDCSSDIAPLLCNHADLPSTLCVQRLGEGDGHAIRSFRVPPKSSFLLGDCADSTSFSVSVRHQSQVHDTRRHFDLMLLDPPWPNRSVKRSHKTPGTSYSTPKKLSDVHQLLLDMDLDMLMASDCLVGMWITNKAAARDVVLGENGLFDTWGVELIEEWLWLKTTVNGEPIVGVDSAWRKPYEIMLLGRKRSSGFSGISHAHSDSPDDIKHRVIVAVPDLHSRKPCLKELIETLVSRAPDYRALEVFARHLVAGWWSWGNECVKFNDETHWRCATPAIASRNR